LSSAWVSFIQSNPLFCDLAGTKVFRQSRFYHNWISLLATLSYWLHYSIGYIIVLPVGFFVQALLDGDLIKAAENDDESKVFYKKMKADYYRYLAEVGSPGDKDRAESMCRDMFCHATEVIH